MHCDEGKGQNGRGGGYGELQDEERTWSTREVLNEVDRLGEPINQFCGHRGQVYPGAERKQAG